MNRTTPNFYEQYGLTRVREAMKRSFNEAFPAWVQQEPENAPVSPQVRTLQAPPVNPLPQPIFQAHGPASGLAPTPTYLSSEPVLRNNPVLPGQPQAYLAKLPQFCIYPMPPTSTPGPFFIPVIGFPYSMNQGFVSPSFGHGQPPTQQVAQATEDERYAKRLRVDEGVKLTGAIMSAQAEELPVWHESKLNAKENAAPYEAFFGVKDKQGRAFVKRILSRSNAFDSNEERINFAEKMFARLSSALEKRQRGIVQILDAELGKLVISIFDLSRKIHRHLENKKAGDLRKRLVGYTLHTVNNNLSIAKYLKSGLSLTDNKRCSTFGGKTVFQLILWCYENNLRLSHKEIHYLSQNKFVRIDEHGESLLKKLRQIISEEEGSSDN